MPHPLIFEDNGGLLGVASGLLLDIDDMDDDGVIAREWRARLRFPSMFWITNI